MSITLPRVGDWMQTYTGKAFWPLDPRVEEIDPVDIAHALSMICRYGGHTRYFYSVAEHCVLMSHAVSPENALWALLHDAAEAYLGDMVRPLKCQMPRYRAVEQNLMEHICARFGLAGECPEEVKEADARILLTERRVLMTNPPPRSWGSVEGMDPLPVTLRLWSPAEASGNYFTRLHELLDERDAA